MKGSAWLLPWLLAACTSADPWRHFPVQSRTPRLPAPAAMSENVPAPAARTMEPAGPVAPDSGGGRRARVANIVGMPPSVPPTPSLPAPVPPRAPAAPAPQPIIGCDAHACTTPDTRVQGGTGNIYLDPAGRPCRAGDGWLQCF